MRQEKNPEFWHGNRHDSSSRKIILYTMGYYEISRKDKIRNTIFKQKMNVVRSLLDDIKTKQLQWYGHVQRME